MSQRYEDPSLAAYLPSKAMLDDVDASNLPSAIAHWKMDYSHMLGKLILPANAPGRQGKVPKDVLLRKYNTARMSWFLTEPDVSSYEQQLEVARALFGEATRFSVSLPCELVQPIGEPGGTRAECADVFETSWFAAVPDEWEGCQAKDVPTDRNAVAYGAPGTMKVTRSWTAEMHLAESGQADRFRLTPAPEPQYVVNPGKAVTCASEPHSDAGAPGVSSITIGPGERVEHVGPRVWCSSARGHRSLTEVRWQGKTCWLETFAVTKAPTP